MNFAQRGYSPAITFTILEDDEQIKARKRFAKFWAQAAESQTEAVRKYEALVEEVKQMPLPELTLQEWGHKVAEVMQRIASTTPPPNGDDPIWRELDIVKIQAELAGVTIAVEHGGEEIAPNPDGTYTLNFSFGKAPL